MIETLITSKTRIKLLLKFFLNPTNTGYLRSLEQEFGESTNAIRLELNRLEQANMLISKLDGNKKVFNVNQQHPLFSEINGIVKKYLGINIIVENIISKLGDIDQVLLTGDLANGKDAEIVDIILIGDVDYQYLNELVGKAEKLIKRRIRYIVMSDLEYMNYNKNGNDINLVIWNK
ncbi:MAG: ArsR family transcriptional regulator [Fulvivirga sp.]|uniref:ArsR family transcriptional regulator n=1 Tax=Fulvivirga sp. TaxID=1931237 RepID=UPI0032EFCF3A